MPDFNKELRLEKNDAADFLRQLANSIEDEEEVMLQGDEWKIYQPFEGKIPFRIYQDEQGLEIGLKMISSD